MRIETQRYTERFGSVRLNDVQQVVELDSGRAEETSVETIGVLKIDEEMLLPGLSAIYHSALCDENIKESIVKELISLGIIKNKEEVPPQPVLYKSPRSINLRKFQGLMSEKMDSYSALAAD